MKILITDDHALLIDSLALLLRGRYGDDLKILHADRGKSALELGRQHNDLDLVLLDIDLPDMHGHQVLQAMKKINAGIPIIAISGSNSAKLIQQSLALGASGFIPKTCSGKMMLSAIEFVLQGGTYIPPDILLAAHATQPNSSRAASLLTDRQLDVLKLIRKGLSNEAIADALNISLPTVKSHVHGILEGLGAKNRTEAVNEALLLNLL